MIILQLTPPIDYIAIEFPATLMLTSVSNSNSMGTVPVRAFDCSSSTSKFSIEARVTGIVPVRSLFPSRIRSSELISPRTAGIVPGNSLFEKSRVTSFSRTLMAPWRLDWIEQFAKCKFSMFTRSSREENSNPGRLL